MSHRADRFWVGRVACTLVALTFLFVTGCESSSKIVIPWKDPSFTGPMHFKKIVALVVHPEKYVRKNGEDEIVRTIGPERCVAGYTFLSDEDLEDINKVKAKLHEGGYDGAVVLRVAGARSSTGRIPQAGNDIPFFSYYDNSGGFVADTGYATSETAVLIQVNIWDVTNEKMIWSGTSETFSPQGTTDTVAKIAKATGEELRKEKLMQ
jgi:hypothetical protein